MATEKRSDELPPVPLTLDGSFILHQMMRVRWAAWKAISPERRQSVVEEGAAVLREMARDGQSALFSVLGHKGDLLILHFRRSLEELTQVELTLGGLKLSEFLEPATSYVSVVELGLYEATVRLYARLRAENIAPGSVPWNSAVDQELEQQRQAAAPRLWPKIPPRRYVCFYPMSKFRGEDKNWYRLPVEARQKLMQEHGMIGRRYAGRVTQIISGSIGFDDWEWGVDLFADDPLVFKKLVYEMRFDEASAAYGLFGNFYVGLQFVAQELGRLLDGEVPAWRPS
jgi:chlorite dismutase